MPPAPARPSPRRVVSTTCEGTGAPSNYTNLPVEPADHALGRSRGGLSTKIHTLTDQPCCPVTVILTPGQSGDNPQLVPLLDLHRRQQSGGHSRRFAGVGGPGLLTSFDSEELRRRRIGTLFCSERTSSHSARRRDHAVGDHQALTPTTTSCATPWNVDTPGSSSGVASPPGIKHALTFLGGVHLAASVLHLR